MVTQKTFLWGITADFRSFSKYHMKVPLGDFNAKSGREDVFKPITGNACLYQGSKDNDVRIE